MLSTDLDKFQERRIRSLMRVRDDLKVRTEDIFVSRRVLETLDEQKAWAFGFSRTEILPLLPFVPNLYVQVCHQCVRSEDLELFSGLARTGLIVPVLTSRYEAYSGPIMELLNGIDHVSTYEYGAFRRVAMSKISGMQGLCGHCVMEERKALTEGLTAPYERKVRAVCQNLTPFLRPDYQLLDDLERAVFEKNQKHIAQLFDLSKAISASRTAQAFRASLVMKGEDLLALPVAGSLEIAGAREAAISLDQLVGEGLGLRIPIDIPVATYIELVQDFRPRIQAITKCVTDNATSEDDLSMKRLLSSIGDINREIERIRGLRRNLVLEAIVSLAKRNPAVTASVLIAGAVGLGGSVLGCVGVPLAAAVDLAKRAGRLRGSEPANRLGRKIRRDLQPSMDKLIAHYLGSNSLATQVMSVRRQVAENHATAAMPNEQ